MSHELSFFDGFVTGNFARPASQPHSFPDYTAAAAEIERQESEARAAILGQLLHCANSETKQQYVRQLQMSLTALSDLLQAYLGPDESLDVYVITEEKTRGNMAKRTFACLERLLHLLKSHCREHFNRDARIPAIRRIQASKEIGALLRSCLMEMENLGFEPELVRHACVPAIEFIDLPPHKAITYRYQSWVLTQLQELDQLLKKPKPRKGYEHDLFLLLCYLDLNSLGFWNYCVSRYSRKLEETEDNVERRQTLRLLIKKISQFQPKPDSSWRRDRPGLKEQVLHWLEKELGYQVDVENAGAAANNAEETEYITTSLNTGQLAFLIRLFVVCAVFTSPNPGAVIRFFAKHFRTSLGTSISEEYLRQKYYSPDLGCISFIRGLFMEMARMAMTIRI